nr:hypothetical protein GCM10020092_051620 [Actinoplanes digitatis]
MTHRSDRTLDVRALARVEGEGAMHVRVRGDAVEEVRLDIYEPPRFFEALLRGRRYTEPPDITARICGICPVAYQMSACAAIEDACAVTVEPGVAALRRLLYCGEWIESHTLHIYLLHAPDFLGYPSALELAKDRRDVVERGLALKKAEQRDRRVARRKGHPPGQRPGRRLLPDTGPPRAGAAAREAPDRSRPGPGNGALGRGLRLPGLPPRPRNAGPGHPRAVRRRIGRRRDHGRARLRRAAVRGPRHRGTRAALHRPARPAG